MKRLALPILLALVLVGCANLERNSYRTIGSTVVAVDLALSAWGEFVRAGQAKPAWEVTVRELYLKEQKAMAVAELAVTAYRKDPKSTDLNKAIAAASAAASDLLAFVSLYVPSVKSKVP